MGPWEIDALQGCFDWTDLEIFDCDDLDIHVKTVPACINFCMDSLIPTKKVKMFNSNGNSKPWITTYIKRMLVEKERAFEANDRRGGEIDSKGNTGENQS